jgi:AraC family transcriptional regulator of adaptative response / DNA-3-methyladenine glycosylase II
MELDLQTCTQARLSRDPRFDGRFFIAVRSSGVYCRSICPAPTAQEKNVRYYPTAAAAAEAGYRPCLRCRPEASPGTPAWFGTSSTVSRALRLISESALEDGGVDALAERLGIGARHLRRLFVQHLGASPIAVANTRRLHFAKKLIDETQLTMGEIAIAAGFGSVRRFNAAIHGVYRRTPTEIRKLARQANAQPENEYLFRVRYRPPFQWNHLLTFLSARAIPGVESVDAGRYRRTITLGKHAGILSVGHNERNLGLDVHISFPDSHSLFFIIERVRRMFDLLAEPGEIAETLKSDSILARRLAALPGLRVPGCWDGFELSIRAILGQQVSVKGASTLAGRLVEKFGKAFPTVSSLTHLFPSPAALADADVGSVGLPRNRAETIRQFARAVSDGTVSFGPFPDSEEFVSRLRELPGIGDWTAQYIAMRALGAPDAFPASDLGLLRGASMYDPRELSRRSEAWRPWRAYAAMYLWQGPPEQWSAASAPASVDYAAISG